MGKRKDYFQILPKILKKFKILSEHRKQHRIFWYNKHRFKKICPLKSSLTYWRLKTQEWWKRSNREERR